jgi:hypothetical protein
MTALKQVSLTGRAFIPLIRALFTLHRSPLPLPPLDSPKWNGPFRAFAWGMSSIVSTVLSLVLFVTYIGIGALAHDTHFSLA